MGALPNAVLLWPAGLWGLVALAVPVIIHLINRSRGKRVLVGNIALLRVARRRRAREIRLEQWLLLLLRLLILVLAALILARLALPGLRDEPRDAIYVTPAAWSALDAEQRATWLDSSTETGDDERVAPDRRLLATGFPSLTTETPEPAVSTGADAWPLLTERLETVHHTGEVNVVTTARNAEFGARPPQLKEAVTWTATPSNPGDKHQQAAAQNRLGNPRLWIVDDNSQPGRTALVDSALSAIQRHRVPGLEWDTVSPDALESATDAGGRRLIWLAEASPSALSAEVFPVQILADDMDWPDHGSDPGFAGRLLHALMTDQERDTLFDHAPVDLSIFPSLTKTPESADATGKPWRPLQPWLALLLVALWSAERWLSERRNE